MHFDSAVGGDEAFAGADVRVFGTGEGVAGSMCGRRFEVSALLKATAVLRAFPEFHCYLDDDVSGGGDDLSDAAPGVFGGFVLSGLLCELGHAISLSAVSPAVEFVSREV
jgi:hypothetical protein